MSQNYWVRMKAIKPGPIEQVITQLVGLYTEIYHLTARTINEGECGTFAADLQEFFPEGVLYSNEDFIGPSYWEHHFLYWNGRYYDSESPQGESDWRNLRCCSYFLEGTHADLHPIHPPLG